MATMRLPDVSPVGEPEKKEERLTGVSPLSEAEKDRIMVGEYTPKAHRIGLWTNLIHSVIFFLPPVYVMVFYKIPVDWGTVAKGWASMMGFSGPFWIIEPISYFVILGVAGTYISFLAGNISNFRIPVSAVAQEVAGVREGSHEGEIISNIAIVASQVVLTISALLGAVVVTLVLKALPRPIVAAFDFLLPAIFGAIYMQFAIRHWRYGVVTLLVAIAVVVYSGLPGWSHIPVVVFVMAILAVLLYNRGIWLPAVKHKA
ncbi:MAG: hypothetical protein HY660_15655 [Armatimonadetes bacterium]|nr:hypothetical protein [Armatimonadota bacterium]